MSETNEQLRNKKCKACEGTEQALGQEKISRFLKEVKGWALTDEDTLLFKAYVMDSFLDAVAFIQQIAKVAESEGHHPDLHLTDYKKLRVELTTHAIGGLSENDFIMAAKINELSPKRDSIIKFITEKGQDAV